MFSIDHSDGPSAVSYMEISLLYSFSRSGTLYNIANGKRQRKENDHRTKPPKGTANAFELAGEENSRSGGGSNRDRRPLLLKENMDDDM
jgi:hypothetical protein